MTSNSILVITTEDFNPKELWPSIHYLNQQGYGTRLASFGQSIRDERGHRYPIEVDLTISEAAKDLESYLGLLLIAGGSKPEAFWYSSKLHNLLRQANDKGLTIGAICRAGGALAPIAKGRTVSAYPLVEVVRLLRAAKANYTTRTISVDGNLVTAEHAGKTQQWVEAFVAVLEGKPVDLPHDSGWTPRGSERKPLPVLEKLKGKPVR